MGMNQKKQAMLWQLRTNILNAQAPDVIDMVNEMAAVLYNVGVVQSLQRFNVGKQTIRIHTVNRVANQNGIWS